MTETILWLIAAVVVFAVVRSILGIVFKGVSDFFAQANGNMPQQQSRPSPPPVAEALKKDPVCGTFLPASVAVTKTVNGKIYYFCSAACRDKFTG